MSKLTGQLSPQTWGLILVFISAVGYGTEAIFMKLAYSAGLHPAQVVWLRFVLAALILSPILMRHWRTIPGRAHLAMLVVGAGINAAVVYALAQSLATTSASVTIVCLYLYPALVNILSRPMLGEHLTKPKVLALLLSLAGIVLVAWTPGGWVITFGIVYALLAAVINALAIVLIKKYLGELPGLVVSAEILAWGAATFTVVGLLSGTGLAMSYTGLIYVLCLAVLSTVIPFSTLYVGLALVDASRAVLVTTVEPLVTALLAAVFLAERLTLVQFLGGALVLSSLLVTGWGERGTETGS